MVVVVSGTPTPGSRPGRLVSSVISRPAGPRAAQGELRPVPRGVAGSPSPDHPSRLARRVTPPRRCAGRPPRQILEEGRRKDMVGSTLTGGPAVAAEPIRFPGPSVFSAGRREVEAVRRSEGVATRVAGGHGNPIETSSANPEGSTRAPPTDRPTNGEGWAVRDSSEDRATCNRSYYPRNRRDRPRQVTNTRTCVRAECNGTPVCQFCCRTSRQGAVRREAPATPRPEPPRAGWPCGPWRTCAVEGTPRQR